MKICLSRWCFMASDGAVCLSKLRFFSLKIGVCLSKIHYLCFSSGILKKGGKSVWEDQKDYIHLADTGSVFPKMRKRTKLTLSFWNIPGTGRLSAKRQMSLQKIADWNQNGNQGRGELRVSYGSEYKRLNQLLLARVERIDSLLAEYNERNPNQITAEVVAGFLADKPLARRDQGKDFVEFTLERLSSDYSRNRIGRSRYENGKSCMNIFQTFLRATKQGSYRPDAIYVGDMTPELLDSYIAWRREVKLNSDATINHALTPILKACAYASEMGMMESGYQCKDSGHAYRVKGFSFGR